MSCSANATVGAYEYQLRAQGQPALELSRLFVYFNGLRLGRRLNKDDGIRISEGMATLASLGVPEEHLWPYATEKWATEPPEDVYKWAWANRPKEFARIKGGDAIRAALARNRPVVLALTLSLECFNEAAKSGVLRAPAANEKLYTPHAMVVVGYDLGAGEYVLRNSWGKAWGDKGYCRVSFETVERCGEAQEYWVVGDVEQLGQAPRDLPGAAAAPPAPPPSSVVGLAAKLREDIRASLTKDIENAAKDIKERMKPKP